MALLSCAAEVAASAAAGTGVIPTGDWFGNVLTNGGVTSTAAASGAASSGGVVATDAAEGSDAKGVPHLGQNAHWACTGFGNAASPARRVCGCPVREMQQARAPALVWRRSFTEFGVGSQRVSTL